MADSTSDAVGAAAAAMVAALGLSSGTPPVTMAVVRRKTPSYPQGAKDPLPQLVVSVTDDVKAERFTATTFYKTYPVAVTLVTAGGLKLEDNALVRQWRDQIQTALFTRKNWVAVPGWNGVNLTTKAPFDIDALSKDYNFATVLAEVDVIEQLPPQTRT